MAARAVSKAAKDAACPARTHAPEHQMPADAPPNLQIPANGRSAVTGIARPDRDQMALGAAVIHARKAAGSRVRIKRAAKANAGPAPARKGVARKVWTTGIGAVGRPKARLHAARGLPSLHARRTTLVVTDQALLEVHAMAARKPGSSIVTHTSPRRKIPGSLSVIPNAARLRPTHATVGPNRGNRVVSRPNFNRKARRVTLVLPSANINAATSAHGLHKAVDLRCGSSITTSIRRVREENPVLCKTIRTVAMAGQGRDPLGRIQRRAPIVTRRTSGPWDLA